MISFTTFYSNILEKLKLRKNEQLAEALSTQHDCKVDDGTSCQECCEHGDMDDGQCLDCGMDRTEELSAQAYDYFKGRD